jgi:hypothetical protein
MCGQWGGMGSDIMAGWFCLIQQHRGADEIAGSRPSEGHPKEHEASTGQVCRAAFANDAQLQARPISHDGLQDSRPSDMDLEDRTTLGAQASIAHLRGCGQQAVILAFSGGSGGITPRHWVGRARLVDIGFRIL